MESRIVYAVIDVTNPDTGVVTNPVVRRVVKRDGKNVFVSGERIIAPDLVSFRRMLGPKVAVEGAPTEDEVRRLVQDMTPEELSKIGLARVSEDGESDTDIMALFSSPEARQVALDEELDMNDLRELAGTGSGRGGRFTAQDIRDLAAEAAEAE